LSLALALALGQLESGTIASTMTVFESWRLRCFSLNRQASELLVRKTLQRYDSCPYTNFGMRPIAADTGCALLFLKTRLKQVILGTVNDFIADASATIPRRLINSLGGDAAARLFPLTQQNPTAGNQKP
jgi:hypothetical protein